MTEFEANTFFHAVLYSLNFDVYMVGSRIYHDKEHGFGGWTHIVNLITIAGKKYMVDGGFGPQGPVDAFPLEADVVRDQVAPAELRLRHDNISNNVDTSQKLWILEHRYPGKEFEPVYCFTDLEFTPNDMVGLNLEPWKNPSTMFTYKVVAVRFTTDKESEESPGSPSEGSIEGEIDGALSLNHDQLRWRRRGKKVLHLKFQEDSERVEALKKYFGIVLAPEDVEAIEGTGSQIGAFDH